MSIVIASDMSNCNGEPSDRPLPDPTENKPLPPNDAVCQKVQIYSLVISTTAGSIVLGAAPIFMPRVRQDFIWVALALLLGSAILPSVLEKLERSQLSRRTVLLSSIVCVSIANVVMGIARYTFDVFAGCVLVGTSLSLSNAEMIKVVRELGSWNSAHKNKFFRLRRLALLGFLFLGGLTASVLKDPVVQSMFGSSWLFGNFPNLLASLCLTPFLVATGVCSSKISGTGTGTPLPSADHGPKSNVQSEELSK